MKKNKCIVIGVASQKGGVAKSTLTNLFAYSLAIPKNRVLVIDLDPQASQTNGFLGLNDVNYTGDSKSNITNIFKDKEIFPIKIFDSEKKIAFDFIPANDELIDFTEGDNEDYENKINKLPNFINSIRDKYDYILLDSPPSFGILTKSILLVSDKLVVPLATKSVDENGVYRFFQKANDFLSKRSHLIKSIFVIPTMYDKRMRSAKEMLAVIKLIPRFVSQLPNLSEIDCKTTEAIPYKVEFLDAPAQRMFLKEYINNYVDKKGKLNEILTTTDNIIRDIAETSEVM